MIWLEILLDSLSVSGVCYSDQALNDGPTSSQRAQWLDVLKSHQSLDLFKPASIGRESTLQNNQKIRNDEISWLDSKRAADLEILNQLNSWRSFLNENLFLSMRTTETHFARYDSGHFYSRHKDQHDSKQARILSFVVYLHDSWKPGDGGELAITNGDKNEVIQIIEPLPGRVVIFKSDEIWHEVRKSNFTRYSLTGWFRHDADAFTPPA